MPVTVWHCFVSSTCRRGSTREHFVTPGSIGEHAAVASCSTEMFPGASPSGSPQTVGPTGAAGPTNGFVLSNGASLGSVGLIGYGVIAASSGSGESAGAGACDDT